LHYFFNHSFRQHLTARSLCESCVKQLLFNLESTKKGCPPIIIDRLVDFYGPKKHPPLLEEVVDEVLIPLLAVTDKPIIAIDGLDECGPGEIKKVVTVLIKLLNTTTASLFIASREELDITRRIQGSIRIRITPENTKEDVEHFISYQIERMQKHHRITESEDMLKYIKVELQQKADRM
jgi:hypothetical protein